MNGMRVLVTGATGFLGGHLIRRLQQTGYEPVALGRNREKLTALACMGVTTVRADLSDTDCINAALPVHVDAIVHAAALSSPWGTREDFMAANVTGTDHIIAIARKLQARKFILISTPSVYFQYDDQHLLSEDTPLPKPVNAYAETKRLAEIAVLKCTELDPIVLRPRGLYGKGDTTLVPRLVQAARTKALPLMRNGQAATDLTHVDDVVDAIIAALKTNDQMEQRLFNISGGVALNVCTVAEQVACHFDVQIRWRRLPVALVLAYARASEIAAGLRPDKPEPAITAYGVGLFAYTQTLDIEAASRYLNWRPSTSFAEGLDKTFNAQERSA